MSNKNGIDSAARTARLHPATPHRKPYRRETVPCDCGGLLGGGWTMTMRNEGQVYVPSTRHANKLAAEEAMVKLAEKCGFSVNDRDIDHEVLDDGTEVYTSDVVTWTIAEVR